MTKPLPVGVGQKVLYKADRSVPFWEPLDGQIATIRSIDESHGDFQYWIETTNDASGKWSGTWAARRELRKIPDKIEGCPRCGEPVEIVGSSRYCRFCDYKPKGRDSKGRFPR